MYSPILAPAAVLAFWSMLVLVWLTASRFGALAKLPRESLRGLPRRGTRGQDLETVLPDTPRWLSHNYTHLMEQPTVFYAVAVILALTGTGTGLNLGLAWAYVGLRIAHSLWQGTVNGLPVRMGLFAASSLCLLAMSLHAVMAALRLL
jgi:hypothetical protein